MHVPVLLQECVDGLNIQPNGIYVDATLGAAGHSSAIAQRLRGGKLIGIDQDIDAIAAATEKLKPYAKSVILVNDNFAHLALILDNLGIESVNGILMDLGVSSYQLDKDERGFSYHADAQLDMRMNQQGGLRAYDVVNTYPEMQLKQIFRDYGEERYAGRIAQRICRQRAEAPIETTLELAELIKQAIPAATRREGGHPAKRVFQAIRIEVNQELAVLKEGLEAAFSRLSSGGRLAIITFHSLEDRIVKTTFLEWAKGCTCPKDFPICVCNNQPKATIVTKKPMVADEEELAENKRAHSAKLRIIQKA